MATELERLVATLEADITRFDKNMTNAQKLFDKRSAEIEKRQTVLQRNLAKGWEMPGFNRFLGMLGATVSVAGIVTGIRAIVAEADRLQDAADQLGLTTEELQGLQAAAIETGAGTENINRGLATLTDNLGKAANGEGEFAKFLRANNIQMGSTMQVLFDLADRTQKASSQNERMAISTMAFGRAGRELVPILAQGREGLQRMFDEAERAGLVWNAQTVAKLDKFNDSLQRLKIIVQGGSADLLAGVATGLENIERVFQHGDWVDKLQALLRLFTGGRLTGLVPLPTAALNEQERAITEAERQVNAAQAALDRYKEGVQRLPGARGDFEPVPKGTDPARIAELQRALDDAQRNLLAARYTHTSTVVDAPPTAPTRTNIPASPTASNAAAEKALRLEQQRQQVLAKTSSDAIAAEAELTKATNDANLARAQGTVAYYALAVKAASDDLNAELAAIAAKEDADIAALKRRELGEAAYAQAVANIQREAAAKQGAAREKAQQAIDAARKPLTDAIQNAEEQIRATQQETDAIGLYGGALAEATMRRDLLNAAEKTGIPVSAEEAAKIDDLARAYGQWTGRMEAAQRAEERNVQLMDGIRQGVEDVGVAALHGAGSFKEALGQMLVQLAELYFRLKVLQPLIDEVLGAKGTSGGGFLGDLFKSIAGSIGGGVDLGGALTNSLPAIAPPPLTGFAKGGRPPKDEPSVVGEEGPELFVPDQAGTIVPHAEAERVIRERVEAAKLDRPDDTSRTIRQRVEAAQFDRPEDAARVIRERVEAADLAQPADAERLVRERVQRAPDAQRAVEDRLTWQRSLSLKDALREKIMAAHREETERDPWRGLKVRAYAGGGIADSPQVAIHGEGSTPEAYVPVPSGRIPVQLRVPPLPRVPRAVPASVVNNVNVSIPVDARGAQKGVGEEVRAQLAPLVPVIVAKALRETDARFAANLHRAQRDDV